VDRPGWIESLAAQRAFFDQFGSRLPGEILAEHQRMGRRLGAG
jgi:hypothetical protein